MYELIVDPEFKAEIRPLTQTEYEGLEADILANGCIDPIRVWAMLPTCERCEEDDEEQVKEWDHVFFSTVRDAWAHGIETDDYFEAGWRWLCKRCDIELLEEYDRVIVDGHNRYEICQKHGIGFEVHERVFESREHALLAVLQAQANRRNLEPIDMVRVLERLHEQESALALERMLSGKQADPVQNLTQGSEDRTRDKLAAQVGVSGPTYDALRKVNQQGDPELIDAVRKRKASASAAADIADLPKEEQREVVAKGEKEILSKAKEIRAQKHAERKQERVEKIRTMEWPLGQFRVIYADPPWEYRNAGLDQSAAQQYETMSIEALSKLPVKDLATDDSVLFLWVTSPLLAEAIPLIESWGFEYKTSIVWVKAKPTYGFYVSVKHELLLICTKGACTPDIDERPESVIVTNGEYRHSQKPDEFRQLIDVMYPHGPRIELFAREAANGWERWGNECPELCA